MSPTLVILASLKLVVPKVLLAAVEVKPWDNVTTPLEAIAIASVSEAEPMLPASAITRLPPKVAEFPVRIRASAFEPFTLDTNSHLPASEPSETLVNTYLMYDHSSV